MLEHPRISSLELFLCIYIHASGTPMPSHCFKNHPYAAYPGFTCRPSELQTHGYLISYSAFPLMDISSPKPKLITLPNKFSAFPLFLISFTPSCSAHNVKYSLSCMPLSFYVQIYHQILWLLLSNHVLLLAPPPLPSSPKSLPSLSL